MSAQAANILVVDDDPGVLDVVAFMLRREGFEVDEEKDGTAALDAARKRPYDIVILDVMLPGMSGTDVCRELRSESDVPILMLTARRRDRPRPRARARRGRLRDEAVLGRRAPLARTRDPAPPRARPRERHGRDDAEARRPANRPRPA